MKLLHVSDLHIGKCVNSFSMIEDQKYILDQILAMVKNHQVDALLIAGDVYDKSLPSAEAVSLVDDFLNAIADLHIPCMMTAGNHDSAERVAYASNFLRKQGFYVSPVFAGSIDHVTLQDEFGPITFWLMPFIKPAMVRAYFPDEDIETNYTKAAEVLINACDINTAERNVILSHQFVTSTSNITERTDSELTLGGMDNVDAHVYDAFDYVALGHVHRPQRVGRDTCRYSGSPLKYSFSEIPFPKTAPLITLGEKGSVDVELLPLVPLRDMEQIKGTIDELLSNDFSLLKKRDNYFYAILTDETLPPSAISRLRSVYPNIMGIDHQAPGSSQPSLNNTTTEFDSSKTPYDLFAEFFAMQNEAPLNEVQEKYVKDVLERIEVM